MKEENCSVKDKYPSKTQENDAKKSSKNEENMESDFSSEIPLLPIIPKRSDKGQLISKWPYEKSVWTKIATKIFPRFLP